ncbi:MAG TPA: B12-binding domain-containing radical SAM protein [Pyrinomonadaceae bacterium]|nr:B12-binding domain-containing radical SAM protein [Pyrinomonadaceae bacterium]
MKALFVYPEFPNTYWSFKHALPLAGKRSAFPPLGLLTLSSMLPASWERRLVDLNVEKLRDADLEWADIVFASAMIVQQGSLRKILDRCKAQGKRIAIGGPFVSTGSEHVDDADFLFLGEAELLLTEFLRDLEAGSPRHIYQTDKKPDLTHTPVPDFALANMKRYSSMCIQFSRGCPFKCEFCDIIEIYGRVPRTKTNAQMIAEFDALLDVGWRGRLFIVDDNFIGNKKAVKNLLPELCDWMERHEYPFSLFTEASVNLADDDALLALMRRANFRKVFLGIETPVEASLKEAQKGQNTRRDLMESVRKIQSYGMDVMAGFIVGFDNDPADIFQRQIDFITQSGIAMAMVGLLTALPDTQLWRRLKAEGRLIFESTGDNTDCTLNFIPKIESETLIAGYKTIMRTLYEPAEYYARALTSLKNTITTGMPRDRMMNLENLLAGVRVVFKLGLLDRSRRDFWRFLRRTSSEDRGLLAEAVALAAMGYHFRRITEQYCGA